MTDLNIAVLGAGVVGLNTALEIQQKFRNAKITVLAETFNTETTSFVAAGLFRPSTSFSGPSETLTRKWINDSFHHWNDLNNTSEASLAGVTELSGYMFSKTSPDAVRNTYLEGLLPIYRAATEEELELCPGGWKYGSFLSTLLIECELYLPWAARKFLGANGKIESKKISKISELSGKYDVVVNCTGLGAKSLCNDKKLVPMRGQVLKVHAPWVKTFFYAEVDTYIIPGFNAVTLGGCRQYDSVNLNICKYDCASIRERCESLLPSLKSAPLTSQRVGLRPHRDIVRVEKEIITTPTGNIKVVHNYGHGGYGVSTSPGTSKYAAQLVKEMLIGNNKL
ncbi:hypothetical protein FQR65_LT07343 [Abscondita terminalis]|nr:hypothetical protein FQR65_LT07343 [Abscondita terminalis]